MSPTDKLRVTVPDVAYWKSQINCQAACPVHTDARGYIRAIAEGRDELAYLIARGPNPLASVCGRICAAPCETACRRGELDKPVAIRALKRFVCQQFGTESRDTGGRGLIEFMMQAAKRYGPRQCQDQDELLPLLQALLQGDVKKVEGKSVGIIGSGPAGLAAAHDLALLGFEVIIYELEPVLAGMLAVGVPEYRLPRDLIRAEVEVILEMGVRAQTSCKIGEDLSFAELRQQHDAVVIAVGLKRSRMLDLPGAKAKGVMGGVEFLRDISLGKTPSLGKRVVVIGGGNVAFDVGRSVLRQVEIDTARSAMREGHVAQVYMCSLESLEDMPADDVEIREGDEEGIIRRNSLSPVKILADDAGNVRAVVFRKCLRVFDENKRFAPLFDDAARQTIECDSVLFSVGQSVDLGFVDPQRDGLAQDERGLLKGSAESGRTSAPDVFFAGDLAYGAKLLIDAVASGKRVARSIYEEVTGCAITHRDLELHFDLSGYSRAGGYELTSRVEPSTLSVAERLKTPAAAVELELTPEQARLEASRCLDCGVNTIFDGSKCILCGGCVDICPQYCLRIVPVGRLEHADQLEEALNPPLDGGSSSEVSVILKDETICIRCGLCAVRCPVTAITMERFHLTQATLCGAS